MTERSLQVTYRKGRTFAAYLHLSHPTGEKSARTVASPDGLLIVDYAASGRPLGVEITAPQTQLISLESTTTGEPFGGISENLQTTTGLALAKKYLRCSMASCTPHAMASLIMNRWLNHRARRLLQLETRTETT
jgi:hypothetical protein